MKDIETVLSKHTPKPKRALSNNFTETVVSEIKSRPQLSAWHRLLATLRVRLLSKVGVSLAGVVLASGTVAAFALWPQPSVTPTITKELPSGNHIVGYNAQNCNYFDELNSGPVAPTSDEVYYEVRQGSSLTDQQLQVDLQAECENNLSNAQINNMVKQYDLKVTGMFSTGDYVIRAISNSSITLKPDSYYSPRTLASSATQTYTHFASNLLTYDESNKIGYGDLKVGDEVVMIVQDTSGESSETTKNYSPLDHSGTINILAIVKVPQLTGDPNALDTLIGTTIVRTEKCTTSPTGFCRAYNFIN